MNTNSFNCCGCNTEYEESPGDDASTDPSYYCKFLGYCDIKCFNKLSTERQWTLYHHAYKNGDIIKRNHKWYLKNIPGYR